MTPYSKLSKQKRRIIDIFREHNGVVNSFYLKIDCRIIQVSVRIKELREIQGWSFLPKDQLKHYKNGSVDYVLKEKPQDEYVYIGNNAYLKGTEPKSEQLQL